MTEIKLPFKPIRVNCKTCKGEETVDVKISNDFLSVVPQKFADPTPVDAKVKCPDCNGSGYYLVKRL